MKDETIGKAPISLMVTIFTIIFIFAIILIVKMIVPAPVDMCNNIRGNQTSLPDGIVLHNGYCTIQSDKID